MIANAWIANACYVICDRCGAPAEISTDGRKIARKLAKEQGYRLIRAPHGAAYREDVCPRCLTEADSD